MPTFSTAAESRRALPRELIRRLPFFYGWVILGCVCCAGFARQGGAVATLSIFVEPMTRHFGWSRTAISGAVSLGGLLAALASPLLGRLLDRQGGRVVLGLAVLLTGAADLGLSLTGSLAMFYALFCVARMNFAGPFDLGIYGAVNNWFVSRRTLAISIATVAQMTGLVALPLIAEAMILRGGWRAGWLGVGIAVLAVGFIPNWLFMVRRPEDVGLLPDWPARSSATAVAHVEPDFTRAQALRTPAFWLLSLFTLLAYPVQAGVSLHQAPFLIERGISPAIAASIVSVFSMMSGVASLGFGFYPRRLPVRFALALVGGLLCASTLAMLSVHSAAVGFLAASVFGLGIGGLL
ncbi:MAG TPA: MFS transporter, partial [Acetobacteraceae bacterium]|nr:MFS transporter [Acetobacteraceae bacterium]